MIIFNLPPALNQLIYALLSIQDLPDIRIRNRLMCIHAVADDLINICKADLPVQELADGLRRTISWKKGSEGASGRGCFKAPELVYGTEDHDRFRFNGK